MLRPYVLLLAGLAITPACGVSYEPRSELAANDATTSEAAYKAQDTAGAAPPAGGEASPGGVDAPASSTIPRKIIYTAQINLLVENFDKALTALTQLVKAQGGYFSQTDLRGSPGAQRYGVWTVRVPVDQFETFLDGVVALGELEHRKTDSQDVTEEFYDLEARLKNKKVEEARLLKHLEESTAVLKDTLEVERELSRVRGEIEQMEGRLRLLANLSSMTTITVSIRERRDYIPVEAPTFATQIARTFQTSTTGLVNFGKSVVLVIVAIVPWLPVILLVVIPIILFLRWLIVRASVRVPVRPVTR